MKIDKNLSINLQYVNDKRRHKYNDIYNFLLSVGESGNGIYPEYIYSIEDKKQRNNKKKEFKRSIKNYFIDKKTQRLKIRFIDSTIKQKVYREYFIAYQMEKINIIKRLHEESMHRGIKALDNIVKIQIY